VSPTQHEVTAAPFNDGSINNPLSPDSVGPDTPHGKRNAMTKALQLAQGDGCIRIYGAYGAYGMIAVNAVDSKD
jgi:hypothetical protein